MSGASATLRVAISVCTSILLAACGGGGGGSTSITAQPASLSFTASPQSGPITKSITATYKGDGAIVGYPPEVPFPSWLFLAETGYTADSIGVAVTASAQGLAPGQYTTTLRFVTGTVDGNGNVHNLTWDDVPVSLTVVNLGLAPAQVSVEAADGSTAAVTGALTLTVNAADAWTAASDKSWLTVEPSGTGPGSLDYSVNPVGLALGIHTGTVTVTGPGGLQVTATISLTIRAALLSVDPASLTFTVDSASPTLSQSLHISDELGGTDAARASSWNVQHINVSWLEMTPASGSSAPGLDATVTVKSQSLATMANGDYNATISLGYTPSDGQPRELIVPVTLHLNSPLQSISVTPGTAEGIVGNQPVQFTATGTFATGYSGNLTNQVTWSSSSGAADVGNGGALANGLSRPLAPGAATITAAMPGTAISGTATFTVTPLLGYAYYSSYYASELFQYGFGASGELQPLLGHTSVPTQGSVTTTLISPSGDYAYLVTGSGIRQYTVNAGGYLELMATVLVPASANTGLIAVDPAEQNLYALAYVSGEYKIRHYSIGNDGSLTLVSATAPGVANAWNIDVLPTGGYLFVTDSSQITRYSIAGDGSLTQLGTTSPARESLALHPSGGAAYAITQYEVRQYTVGADGALTPMSPAGVALGSGTTIGSHVVVDATGTHAYAIDSYQQKVRHFTIGADLKLTVSGTDATGVPYTPIDAVLEPSGKYLYVTGNVGQIAKYTIDENGDIVGAPATMGVDNYPRGFAVRAGQ